MNHSHQTVCLTRGYLFCFCLLITLGYSPRVDWESGIGVIAIWSCSEDEQVASAFIYYYMELYVYSAVQCQLQWHLLLLYDNNERQCSEALCTKNIAHWGFHYVINCDTLISYLLSLFDHVHCRLFVSSLIIIFYHCAVRYYRLWKILISLRDSYSRRVPSLSSGAR